MPNLSIEEILDQVQILCRKHHVEHLYLFGSRANGTATETSDIDIIIKGGIRISDDTWIQMLDMRNELSHDYDGSLASDSFGTIVHDFIPLFQQFREIAGSFIERI